MASTGSIHRAATRFGAYTAYATFAAIALIATPFQVCAYDFIEEVTVSSGDGTASSPSLTLDSVDNVFLTFIENEEVTINIGPLFEPAGAPLTEGDSAKIHPSIHVPGPGKFTVVYEEEGEILYIESFAGTFEEPMLLSLSDDPDLAPEIARGVAVPESNVVWVVEDAGGTKFVHVSRDLGRPTELVEGNDPTIATDATGVIYVAYERGGDLFHTTDGGLGFGTEETLTTGTEADSEPALELDSAGVPSVVFVRDGQAALLRGDGAGGFLEPLIVSDPAHSVSNPHLSFGTGVSFVLYEAAGDLWLTTITGDLATPPENVSKTLGIEDQSLLRVDSIGLIHIAYRRDGEIYYRNDAAPPVPDFIADVTDGDAPLDVLFTSTGTGYATHHVWDFGDGETASGESIEHTYHFAGVYDVSLTSSGPGGEYSIVYNNLISVSPPSNVMSIPNITVFQGEPEVIIPVIGKHADPAQGYQIAAAWNEEVLMMQDLVFDATDIIGLSPEFVAPTIVLDGQYSYFTLGLVLDFSTPFDGRTLPAGNNQRLVNMEFDVKFQTPAPAVTTIELRNDLGDPVIANIFTVEGTSALAALDSGDVTVIPFVLPAPTLFVRGDFNNDASVSIVDAIGILSYLFQSGAASDCLDASDVNDDGAIGIVDAIVVLNFLFTDIPGSVPAYPFPGVGLDPTADPLGDC